MKSFFKKISLETVVFICGASTMILELTGSRIMAPYVGTSIYVWTSLIGVILGFLSLGYWLGGRMADRDPSPRMLSFVILASALWIALTAFLYDLVLSLLQGAIRDPRFAALLGSFLLFSVPSTLLGMVLPYAVKLKTHSIEDTGQTVGNLYALSTFGSIAGTFLAGFVLLAYLKNSVIFFVLCVFLFTASLLVSGSFFRMKLLVFILALSAMVFSDQWVSKVYGSDFIDANTLYNRVWIYDMHSNSKGTLQVMQIGDEISSLRLRENNELAGSYTRYYRLCSHFNPGIRTALMLGGAGYAYPQDFLRLHPQAIMDVVEIDSGVTRLAREHFGLKENGRLKIYHQDARTFLNQNTHPYDAILMDAFQSSSVPFHLTTLEMMQAVSRSLSENGVFFMNMIASIDGDAGTFLKSEVATLKRIFPQVYVLALRDSRDAKKVQNLMLIALKSSEPPLWESANPEWDAYLKKKWTRLIGDAAALTDDFAPVERYQSTLYRHIELPESPFLLRWKRAWGSLFQDR